MIPWSLKELFHYRQFSLLFIINLTIGLTGPSTLEFFKTSLNSTLEGHSLKLLGTDLLIQSRRKLLENEKKIIERHLPPNAYKDEFITYYSMISNPSGKNQLTFIRAITNQYPYYGEISLHNKKELKEILQPDQIYISKDLTQVFNAKIGDELSLGGKSYRVGGIIEKDEGNLQIGIRMAPSAFIEIQSQNKKKLLGKGNLVTTHLSYHWKSAKNLNEVAKNITRELERNHIYDIKVKRPHNAGRIIQRGWKSLTNFMSLVSLISLFLSLVGMIFLFQNYLYKRLKDCSLYLVLGLNRNQIKKLFITQLVLLSTFSGILSYIISLILAQVTLPYFINTQNLVYSFNIQTPLTIIFISVITSILLAFPYFRVIENFTPRMQFLQEFSQNFSAKNYAIGLIPLFISIIFLIMWSSNSLRMGMITLASLIGVVLLILLIYFLLFATIKKKSKHFSPPAKTFFNFFSHHKYPTLCSALALCMSSFFSTFIPQIARGLQDELSTSPKLPTYFLFDIQEDELDNLNFLAKKHRIKLHDLSPLVRSRLSTINGKGIQNPLSKTLVTAEDERASIFRRRGYNLTIRDTFSPYEKLLKGKSFQDFKQIKYPPVSLEYRFARRLGLKIGDILEFNVQGFPLTVEVANLRSVKWTSFRPNFFIVLPSNVIDDFPKTYLANVTENKKVTPFQNEVVKTFPHISFVHVKKLVKKISFLLQKMDQAIRALSILVILSGLCVLYSVTLSFAKDQSREINLLKLLGFTSQDFSKRLIYEYLFIGVLPITLGTLFSLIPFIGLNIYIFDAPPNISWTLLFSQWCLLILLCFLVKAYISRKTLKTNFRQLLQEE